MNKILAFANQKGGVGKTTLSILFANYLAWKKKNVVVLDADIQRSITTKREKDREFYADEPPYEVQYVGIGEQEDMQLLMSNAADFDGVVIIDCPGNVRDNGIAPVLANADAIIIPYEYEDLSLEATTDFVQLLNSFKARGSVAKYIFVPNKIQANIGTAAETSVWKQCANMYSMVGKVVPKIKLKVDLKRIDTYEIVSAQRAAVMDAFEAIIKELEI